MIVLNDFATSVKKALSEIDPKWESYAGLIVCGTHSPQNTEEMIEAIRIAKEVNIPTLGICFGMQLMAIEYARSELGIKDATSEEFGEGKIVINKMPELRVGIYPVLPKGRLESHWHNYTLDKMFEPIATEWSKEGLIERIDIGNRIGVQYHPEYGSSEWNPHELLVEFINKCKNHG
jgi:CTP synthase